jgi:bifunctional isochorismate lyase/aryl carrier protein
MSIPSIQAYAVPRLADMPTNKVSWKLEPSRAALLIHDMQDYFLRFYDRSAQPVASMLAHIAALRIACAARGIPIIYTAQPPEQSSAERGLLNEMWGPGLTAFPEAHHIVDTLRPSDADIVLTKYRYSAFHRTALLDMLRARGRDQLLICGVYAHIGCLLTACDAFMNDIQPFFVADAVADFSPEYHKLAVGYAAERCAVTLLTSEVLAALTPVASSLLAPEEIRAELRSALELGPELPSWDENLFDLGLDSIRLMSLVELFRQRGGSITFAELGECTTAREMAALLCPDVELSREAVRA